MEDYAGVGEEAAEDSAPAAREDSRSRPWRRRGRRVLGELASEGTAAGKATAGAAGSGKPKPRSGSGACAPPGPSTPEGPLQKGEEEGECKGRCTRCGKGGWFKKRHARCGFFKLSRSRCAKGRQE
jgi:hypothetical protein